jgi:hypothetical protein
LWCLGVLRVAGLEIVVNLGHASDMLGDGFGQFTRGIGRNRSRKSDFALDRSGGNEIILERLGSVQGMNDVHLNLPVGALTGLSHRGASGWFLILSICN